MQDATKVTMVLSTAYGFHLEENPMLQDQKMALLEYGRQTRQITKRMIHALEILKLGN